VCGWCSLVQFVSFSQEFLAPGTKRMREGCAHSEHEARAPAGGAHRDTAAMMSQLMVASEKIAAGAAFGDREAADAAPGAAE
jgi:hypothetical protein